MQKGMEKGMQKGMEKGMEKGMQKGIEQGVGQGEALLLQRQLTRRFGPLPAAMIARIAAASVEEIETWGDRVLDATSLDEVFRPS
jgi:flagellar biosynthesis/type III secretory pathway protein FliH